MAKELFIGNLPWSVDSDGLKQHFAAYSPTQANVVSDRDSGRSRGFGFVKFDDDAQADKAVAELNGKELDGRELTVREATPRQ
ncbi:MAG TPA: RNA-binding protein [Patescibacteria group bacterium]|jgi:RNA recognition motif-containing protein